jgi:hypothetical protein
MQETMPVVVSGDIGDIFARYVEKNSPIERELEDRMVEIRPRQRWEDSGGEGEEVSGGETRRNVEIVGVLSVFWLLWGGWFGGLLAMAAAVAI